MSLFFIVMHGEARYDENTSGLDAEVLCSAYAGYRLLFMEMIRYGWEIGIKEYARFEQGTSLLLCVK